MDYFSSKLHSRERVNFRKPGTFILQQHYIYKLSPAVVE